MPFLPTFSHREQLSPPKMTFMDFDFSNPPKKVLDVKKVQMFKLDLS